MAKVYAVLIGGCCCFNNGIGGSHGPFANRQAVNSNCPLRVLSNGICRRIIFFYGAFLFFAIVVGLLARLFPATVLSGFQPIKVLKNLSDVKLFSRVKLRKALLVSQFALSLIFIISVIVMNNQLKLFIGKDHGFATEKNMIVRLNNTSAQRLKTELSRYNNIENVSAASHIPATGVTRGNGFKKDLAEKDGLI